MYILVACEESQEVCKAFREKGHMAFSCDIIECSGGHPEWHIKADVKEVLFDNCIFETQNGDAYGVEHWDMIIAFPPCTHLCSSGARWFKKKREDGRQEAAIKFFMQFVNANCEKIAIENPVGIMSTFFRKPDQIIQPFQFGHPFTKSTCLWLKGLPELIPTDILTKPKGGWDNQSFTPDGRYGGFNSKFNDAKTRSKTFSGIAKAMAEQWG